MPDIEVPDRPILRDVPDVELLKVGQWPLSTGTVEFTTEDLAAAVRASQSPAVSRPVIKLGHCDPRFDAEPAVGFVDNLRLSSDGTTLVGDLRGVPAWLADIMPSAYPRRSIEGAFSYRDQSGVIHSFALTGLALLGVTPPAVGTLSSLRDVAALYEVNAKAGRDGPAEGIRIMPEIVQAAASVEDVRRHFYEAGPGAKSFMWIEEMFLDPSEVIVMDEEDGQLYRIPFTVAEDGAVSWGEQEAVKREYVAASARTPDAVWGSAEESRDVAGEESPPTKTKEQPPMEFTEDQVNSLIAALGLNDSATADDVVKAVEKIAADVQKTDTEAATDIAAAVKQRGLRLVEASAWKSAQDRLAALEHEGNVRLVDDAVAAGKFMPASRAAVLKQVEAGLIDKDTIDAMEPIVTMAGAERGHAGDSNNDSTDVRDSDVYKNWE
ncbi:hypothetical protein WG936_08170 [Corynebacterium sp. H127]|uniref:hypothetical protein n=1 Tax=Corynebacterium sp. H127 TaxID=3133418 RepID=UPI0030B773A3